jgi:23S rRNA (adenine2503-C2)-methyltransferase
MHMPIDENNLQKLNPFGMLPESLVAAVKGLGLPAFRADQVRSWMYRQLVSNPADMTNLGGPEREKLLAGFDFEPGRIVKQQDSTDGTRKLLIEWKRTGWTEPATTECVMIPDHDRRTACVSSQVGCPVGCKFCASGLNGLKGNLDVGEIVYQLFCLNKLLAAEDGSKITNVVFMGMGEPMSNYANVMGAVRILHDNRCFGLGARRITISTVGVPAKIRDMASESLAINLALSLHAPNEPLRKQLIPWASHFALEEILDACRYYFDQTGREIMLEYILLHEVNDHPEQARELVKVCKTMRATVNLIRYNEVEGLPFTRPKTDRMLTFQQILRDAGVIAHVRKSRGRDIDAACGQLRRKAQDELIQIGK